MAAEISKIVIVGGGQAGYWAARTLRGEGFSGSITLIGEEAHIPYERPPLSKAVLTGEAAPESCYLVTPEAFATLELDFRSATQVQAIDRDRRKLVLSNGALLSYDRLILATGGRARSLEIAGAGDTPVFTLRTMDDALEIGAALDSAKSCAIIGGGWIGLEIAAAAVKKNVEVSLFEAADRLCHRVVPGIVSDWLFDLHRAHGVDLRLGSPPAPEDLAAADLIVVGIGLVANDDIAREAGIACDNGILTDACGRTNDPNVFACGDVSVFTPPGADRPMRLESWGNAQNQAIACAKTVLGREVIYDEIPWFWSDQYDANIQILGFPPAGGEAVLRGSMAEGRFSLFWLGGDRLTASLSVNVPIDIKVAKRLISAGKPVSAAQLADEAVVLKSLLR